MRGTSLPHNLALLTDNASMTSGRTGTRRASKRSRPGAVLAAIVLVLGAGAAGAVGVYLVSAATDFGALARGGQEEAWWFAFAASLGALVCLLLLLVLVVRALYALGIISDYRPRRAAVRRRARSR